MLELTDLEVNGPPWRWVELIRTRLKWEYLCDLAAAEQAEGKHRDFLERSAERMKGLYEITAGWVERFKEEIA